MADIRHTKSGLWPAITRETAAFRKWIRILAQAELIRAFPLSSVSYLFVIASGWFLFDETLAPLQIMGASLIIEGVWHIGSAQRATPFSNSSRKDKTLRQITIKKYSLKLYRPLDRQ
jgi:hypothetical protein